MMKRRLAVPYLYIAPAMSLFALLMMYPMGVVFWFSQLDRAILNPDPQFVGLENFRKLFSDPDFIRSIANTMYFTTMSVIFHLLLGLAFALLLNSRDVPPRLRAVLRVAFILPWLFTPVIIAVVWRLILDPNGVINAYLMAVNIMETRIEWFSSTKTAIHALTFVNIWAGYPLYMVSILAALQGIPSDLYEASEIDGATALEKFRFVTLPHLTPIIAGIALLDFIWTMQVFPLVWLTTGGGPLNTTEMLSTYTYKLAFTRYQFSQAAASAMIIFLLSMTLTYFYILHQRRHA